MATEYAVAQQSQSLIIKQNGKTLVEQYSEGTTADTQLMLASGTKSFNGVIAMCAVEEGRIKLSDPAWKGISEWKNDPAKSKITLDHLLHMTSGLAGAGIGDASPTRQPAWSTIVQAKMQGVPDRQYVYGAHHLNAFAYALQNILKTETFEAYLERKVLKPLGIRVNWKYRCADGNPQVGGGAFMTARDWSKFGEMLLGNGTVNGIRILKPESVRELSRASDINPSYGLTFWLKSSSSSKRRLRVRQPKDVEALIAADWLPSDLIMAAGAGKQRLYIVPSLNLVAVRQGGLRSQFSDTEFLSRLIRGKAAE